MIRYVILYTGIPARECNRRHRFGSNWRWGNWSESDLAYGSIALQLGRAFVRATIKLPSRGIFRCAVLGTASCL